MHTVAESLTRLSALASSPAVAAVARAFDDAGFELALVGGPVRDAFLGRRVHDFDFASNARPDDLLRILRTVSRTQWDVGRAYGTIGALVAGEKIEVTTYRADSYDGLTRKPDVVFGDDLGRDLSRRDFSVNAIAFLLPQRRLVDPSGGIDDLLAGRLRTPASPEISFGDDPLRMLRAARFAAQLGFTPSEATRTALTQMSERIGIVSAERVRDELVKLLAADSPRPGLELLVDSGLARHILPELPALQLEVDEHHHHKDVYRHTLTVVDQAIGYERQRHPGEDPDTILRLAALLHDIGKPATRRYEAHGVVSFHHHDVVGAKLARTRLRALRFDNATVAAVTKLIELHLRFFGYTDQAWTDSAVRRYVHDAGDQLERLHMLTRADVTTRNQRKADMLGFAYDDLEDRIAQLAREEDLAARRPDLDGTQIMAILGIPPGPEVGRAYRHLLDLRIAEGPLGTEEATRRLLAWRAENG